MVPYWVLYAPLLGLSNFFFTACLFRAIILCNADKRLADKNSNLMEPVMVDEISNPDAAPIVVVDVALVESAPAITETPIVETPSVEASVSTETIVSETKSEIPVAETLLGAEKKPQEAVSEEKPEGEAKTEETPSEEAPLEVVELPKFEPFQLPEGVQLEPEKIGEFTKSLAEFESKTKASHEEVQALGQQFLNKHIEEMQRYHEFLTQSWNKQKTDWKDSFLKDPEFSNRTETAVNAAIDAINVYAGDNKQQKEFVDLMESTGLGNHPAMIRLLSNVMLAKAEPKPLAAPQIASGIKQSKISKMYGTKK